MTSGLNSKWCNANCKVGEFTDASKKKVHTCYSVKKDNDAFSAGDPCFLCTPKADEKKGGKKDKKKKFFFKQTSAGKKDKKKGRKKDKKGAKKDKKKKGKAPAMKCQPSGLYQD